MDNTEQNELQIQPVIDKIPKSYVLWLTWRSQFIDDMAQHDDYILDKWKDYENQRIQELENLNIGGQ